MDGTFPVYLKYYFTYMDGTNPDGSKYHDPVYYANYFNGGDAVHEFSPGQLRVLPEPGLRRAALGRGQEGLRLPLLRQPGHGDRTGGLRPPRLATERGGPFAWTAPFCWWFVTC